MGGKAARFLALLLGLALGCPAPASIAVVPTCGLRVQTGLESGAESELAAGLEEPPRLYIPWMLQRDYMQQYHQGTPPVLEIERAGEGVGGYPGWTEKDFLFVLQGWEERDFQGVPIERNTIGMVAEDRDNADRVVGFMVYGLYKSHLHLFRLAVHPDYRRRGVGRALVELLISKLSPHRYVAIAVDVPDFDLDAQRFLRKMEFQAIGTWEDPGTDQALYRFVTLLPDAQLPKEILLEERKAPPSGSFPEASGDEARPLVSPPSVSQELPMDRTASRIREGIKGEFVLEQALEMLRVLEFIVSFPPEEIPFTRWGDAYAVLKEADRRFGLGEAAGLLPLLEDSDRRDPRMDLYGYFEQFRSSHQGQHTYEALDPMSRSDAQAGPSTGLRAGLEEPAGGGRFAVEREAAVAGAVAQEAFREGFAVVVDAVGLEEFPQLMPLLRHLGERNGLFLLGESGLAEDLARLNPLIRHIRRRSADAVLAGLEQVPALAQVTYFGPRGLEHPVRRAADSRRAAFHQPKFSFLEFFRGMGLPSDLAGPLAAGLEQALSVAREA